MAKVSERVIALVAAVVFFATSVGVTVLVIMQANDQKNQQADLSQQLAETQDAADQQIEEVDEQPKEGALKGTALADFTPTGEVSEIQIIDLRVGDGATVAEGGTITAHYTGAYAVNGEIFESSKDSGSPLTDFALSDLIDGWKQGIPGMKVGGLRRLVIPGRLAYGEAPEGYTPGSTGRPMGTLVFDIEMLGTK